MTGSDIESAAAFGLFSVNLPEQIASYLSSIHVCIKKTDVMTSFRTCKSLDYTAVIDKNPLKVGVLENDLRHTATLKHQTQAINQFTLSNLETPFNFT